MTDYIKREDAVAAMAKYEMDMAVIDNPESSRDVATWEKEVAKPVMDTVPPSDVRENVKAEWVGVTPMTDTLQCSNCGYNIVDVDFATPFCPICGAEMDEYVIGMV